MNIFTHKPADSTPIMSPVTVEQARAWVKTDSDDAEVPVLLADVLTEIEEYCRQPIFEREFVVSLPGFESGLFASLYVSEVVSVAYRIVGETDLTNLDEANFTLFENSICFKRSVCEIENVDKVDIRFKAGLNPLPGGIRQVIRLMLANWYEYRASGKEEFPSTAGNLLRRYILPIA